jgi:hypothetical protein
LYWFNVLIDGDCFFFGFRWIAGEIILLLEKIFIFGKDIFSVGETWVNYIVSIPLLEGT